MDLVGNGERLKPSFLTELAGSLHARFVIEGELDLLFQIILGSVRIIETDFAIFQKGCFPGLGLAFVFGFLLPLSLGRSRVLWRLLFVRIGRIGMVGRVVMGKGGERF